MSRFGIKKPSEESPNMSLNFKTPERTLEDALNFNVVATTDDETTTTNNNTFTGYDVAASESANTEGAKTRAKRSVNQRLKQFMQRMNNSAFVYPTITILVMTLIVIVVIFQSSISMIIKVLLVLVLLAFLTYTVWQFRGNKS